MALKLYYLAVVVAVFAATNAYAGKWEKDYVNDTCEGLIEYVLEDKARVDCLTGTHAIEYDFAHKWAEAIGQALYYSRMTGKAPGVVLISRPGRDDRYIKRFRLATEANNLFIQLTVIPR